MEKHHLRVRHFLAIIILWKVFIFTRALDEKLRIITLVIPGPMSHVATQQITFDIHQEPRTGPATSSPQYHCFTFQLMEDNVPMPSLDTVSISKPFYKSWTSQAEVNQHHPLLAHLISLLFFAESIPFADVTSQTPEISRAAVQHLASKCFPWPVIFPGCQSES